MSTTENDTTFDVSSSAVDEIELSDNISEDIVEYLQGKVIKNEQQGLLLTYSWVSGWQYDESDYVNMVTIGSPSGGKTHLNRTLKQLLPENSYYSATDVSEAGIYNDHEKWNSKRVAIFSEWNKLSAPIREVVKSLAGDDGGAERVRSEMGEDDDEWSAGSQSLDSKPYTFSYAQHSLSNEISDRLFFNYISEDVDINEAVAKKHSGHEHISVDGGDVNYIYDVSSLKLALKRHFRNLPEGARTIMPEYMYYAYSPCLDLKRSDVKRTANMVPSLMRASAIQNYHSRPTIEVEEDGNMVEKIVVMPQDCANVLSCREVLIGTTHNFEIRKQGIVDAVRANTQMSDWCSLNDIVSWLNQNASEVSRLKKGSLREILNELEEDFIIEKSERYFDSGAHAYRFRSLSDIGSPKLTGFRDLDYESEDPLLGVDDPDAPFKDCTDPTKGIPFSESVDQFREKMSGSFSTSASTAMNGDDGDDNGGQNTLSGESAVDTTISDPIAVSIYDRLQDVDGATYEQNVSHEVVLGMDGDVDNDPLLDPTNEVYQHSDVTTSGGARSAIEDSMGELYSDGVLEFVSNDDGTMTLDVHECEVER